MALFSSTQPSLRARVLPRFPAQVLAGNGITITRSGGTYTFAVTSSLTLVQVFDNGTVSSGTVTLNASLGSKQKLTVAGPVSVALVGWPSSGIYGEIEIQLINGGNGVSWPAGVNWYVGDGTSSNSFGALGVTLATVGTNWVVVWTTDGGATLSGRAI